LQDCSGETVIKSTPQTDEQLRDLLHNLSVTNHDYWSFRGNSNREHGHGLFHYPAMMVPQVARALLEQICSVHPQVEEVGDPFMGSGTVLTESMNKGLCFSGTDINPLAILLCQVKAGPFELEKLEEKAEKVVAKIESDVSCKVEVDFANRDKWFRTDVQVELSKIRRAILKEKLLWVRRFFWVCLAESVRYSSNSRTSTYKLHTRTEEEISNRAVNAIELFKKAVNRNLVHMENQADNLEKKDLLDSGNYNQKVVLQLGDIRQLEANGCCDVILTSPPYGDNTTTVPYGQYSYLPLQWIKMTDIDHTINGEWLSSTHAIDSRSLGGSKRLLENDINDLSEKSPAYKRCVEQLENEPKDRVKRVTSFFRDLNDCLKNILSSLRPGGVMAWALGNRKVGGIRVPLDEVLSELMIDHGVTPIYEIQRSISSKRMAPKNNIADTISKESILVMRKANE
jgi:hypothetical protein